MRLELLLDYSRKLPPIPDRLAEQRDAGMNRVPECMTPVFLWIEGEPDELRIHVDVAEEAPTVKGIMGIIFSTFDGAAAEELQEIPLDLLNRLGLGGKIRMNRAMGVSAIISRVRRAALEKRQSG
jgi:cysteine desulfuration protein SufE